MDNSRIRRSWKLRFNTFLALLGIALEQMMLRLGLLMAASKLNYSQACEQAQLNATTTTVGNAGLLYIYSGTQPSGPAGIFTPGALVARGAANTSNTTHWPARYQTAARPRRTGGGATR